MVFSNVPDTCSLLLGHSDLSIQVVLFWDDLIKPPVHPHPCRQTKIQGPGSLPPQKYLGSQAEWQSL